MSGVGKLFAGLAVAGALLGLVPEKAEAQGSWSGIYIGANAGWAGQDFDWAFNPPIPMAAHQAYSLSQDSGIAGGQIGIQHQWGQIVLGVEAAFSGRFGDSDAKEIGFGNNLAFDSSVRMGPIFTIGPRLGWAPSRQWMIYATGGFATANITSKAVDVVTGLDAFSASDRHNGWFAGGGVEFAINPNVILGVEYQRVSLDTEIHCPGDICLGAAGGFVDRDISGDIDIVRARLSFKLGRVEEPPPYYEPLK